MPAADCNSAIHRRLAALLTVGISFTLWTSLGRAQTPPGASAPKAPPGAAGTPSAAPRVIDFEGRDGKWVWLKQKGSDPVEAWQGGQGSATQLANGSGWTEISCDGETIWLLGQAALLRIAGSQATPVETGLAHPGGLWAADGKVYWIETRAGVAGGWNFVPSSGPISRLRVREGDGPPRDLAEWPGAMAGPGDILGVANDALYVRVRRTLSTEFLRVPVTGGIPTRISTEGGAQEAVLQNGALWWTAPSEEAMLNHDFRCVRGENGATVTEWLPAKGHLMVLNGVLHYAVNSVYRIPKSSGTPLAPEYLGRILNNAIGDDGRFAITLSAPGTPAAGHPER